MTEATTNSLFKDTITHINKRLSGNFFPAFIVSFILVNRKVFYITLFVSEEYLYRIAEHNNKYVGLFGVTPYISSKLEYVSQLLSWQSIVRPVVGVIGYYLIMPIIDDFIEYGKFWVTTWNNNGGIKSYFGLYKDYDQIQELLPKLNNIIMSRGGHTITSDLSCLQKEEINKLHKFGIINFKYGGRDNSGFHGNIDLTYKGSHYLERYISSKLYHG